MLLLWGSKPYGLQLSSKIECLVPNFWAMGGINRGSEYIEGYWSNLVAGVHRAGRI